MFLKVLTQKNKKDGHVRKYLQLVESRRIDGQPRQVVLASLGRFDNEQGEQRLAKLAEAFVKATERLSLLDLAKDLKALNSKEYGPLLVFKRIWQQLGLGKVLAHELRNVDTEFEPTEAIFNMVLNRLTAPSSKRQLCLWEPTVAYSGDSDQHEQLLDYGLSKIRRGDLKQVVVGIIMSKDGIPLGHEVFAANRNDVSCFAEIIDTIAQKYQLGRLVLVGDRGMISKKNINKLEDERYQYILGYRMRTIPKEHRRWVLSKANLRKLKHCELQFKEVRYDGQRLIVCYNAERAEKDAQHRERILERLERKIQSGKLSAVIDNSYYKRFLLLRGAAPAIDWDKVEQDAEYDGVFVLTTNTRLSAVQTVESYKELWHVELAFGQLKSEIEIGPIYHFKDRRIRAHIMVCFLAFVLRTVFYKKLKVADKDASFSHVMSDLKALSMCELEVKGQPVKVRTELQPGANLAFRALGMRPPNRIYTAAPLENVVVRA